MTNEKTLEVKHPQFAERFKEMMKRLNLDLKQISKETGINYEMLRRYEHGYAIPRKEKMTVLSEFLNVPASWLQYGGNNDFSNNSGVINHNITNSQNTNNFFQEDTTPEKARQILGDEKAEFLTAMPILGIDDGVEFALNPAEKGLKLKDQTQRAATFIPHSDRTFAVKMADNMLKDITPSPILQNDILIVEPLIAPRNQDLVLVCLDYQTPRQRGIFARLHMDLIGNFNIKHSELPYERLPENALICGVVVEIKRRLLPNDLVLSRIDETWDILNTLQRKENHD